MRKVILSMQATLDDFIEAQALLRAFDSTVTHYEIVLNPEQEIP